MKLLAIERISEMLNVSTRQVWRLRNMGKVPMPVKLGTFVRWWDEPSRCVPYLRASALACATSTPRVSPLSPRA
jgi:hypothetical protein